jgi:hypothetical protein
MASKKPDPKKKSPPAPARPTAPSKPRAARAPAPKEPAPATKAAPKAPVVPDLRPGPKPVLGDIPWDYGQDRVTAIARDPHCLFAYWSFSDAALEKARQSIEAPQAGIVLRVYDTTYRMFDGTNANSYFDLWVERNTNRYYFNMNRPASTFVVDVGVNNGHGRFATIARSGAAELPRDGYSPDGRVEWKTVGPTESYRKYEHRYVPKPGGPPPPPASGPSWPSIDPEHVREVLAREGWVEEQWTESAPDGNQVRWIRWSGPVRADFSQMFPGRAFEKIEVEFQSGPWIVREEKGERRVFGPWNVSVYAWETRTGRKLISRWMMHSSWVTEERSIRVELPVWVYRIVSGAKTTYVPQGSEGRLQRETWSSEAMMGGASEMRWLGGSELRMAGSSEQMFLSASEWMALGASEWFAEASSFNLGGSERWGEYKSGNPLFPPGGEKP